MNERYSIITAVFAENTAATGTRIIGTAYLTKGPGSGVLVADASSRALYYYTRTADGNARPSGIAFASTKFNIQMTDENATRYENVLVDLGYEAGDSRLKILGINETTGVTSVGGVTPGEQADNANTFTAQANIVDLRVTPLANSVEYQIASGAYYDDTGAIQAFTGATTAAATNSIASRIASLSAGQHVVAWIVLNTSTGGTDTVIGTPIIASGTLPNPAEFNSPSAFNGITITAPLKGLVPVYVYYGQNASADAFVYRAYDARGAFGSPSSHGGLEFAQVTAGASATVSNTTTETTLFASVVGTQTLAANALSSVGRMLRIDAWGYIGDLLTPTLRVRFKLGSTAILDTGAIVLTTLTGNKLWHFNGVVTIQVSGASGKVFSQGQFTYNQLITDMLSVAQISIDTTGTLFADLTGQFGTANAANTIVCTNALIEVLN